MKQLYAAGPLSASNGPRMRAATTGARADEIQAALSFSNYAPPPGRGDDAPLPVRLALLQTSAGRVLTHITPNGGTYFAHALLNVPDTADAQLAIQTWGSPLWQRHEPDSASDLPDLPYLPVGDLLDDGALRDWIETPARRDLLEFVLTALLGTPATTRIFVAAPAEDVAKVVYAVTRALPPGLLDDFTFSTYEPDPLACQARLVGHDTGAADWELPTACYSGNAVGFNPATGRRTELASAVPFASFAVASFANGDLTALDEVKTTWQRFGLKEPRQFDLVFRLARGTGVLTKPEAAEALQHPPLAAWLATRADAMRQFLEWALDDRDFATTSLSRAVQALRQKADVTAKLGQSVRDEGVKALLAGDRTRTANALEVILPMVAPSKANAVWGELLGQLTDPDQLSWEVRWYLLPRFVRFKQQQGVAGVDPALAKWLSVPTDHLGELLGLDVPRGYHLAGCRAALARDGEPTPHLVRTLGWYPALTLALLQPTEAVTADRAVTLYEALLDEAPSHPWFEDLLARAADYPAALLNRFFESTLAAGKIDADRLIRIQGTRLLELFAGQSGLDRIGTLFLASPPPDLLRNKGVLEFLGELHGDAAISATLKARIAAVESLRSYLDKPTFTAEAMRPTAEALAVTPPVAPPTTKGAIFDAVASELLRRASAETLQVDLETLLVEFGSTLANDEVDLYENLLRELRGRTDFGRQTNLVRTFLAVALGAAKAPELGGKLDGLDGHAFAVASEAAKRGGARVLAAVDKHAESWPKAARTQWHFLHEAVRPRGFRGVLRDAGLVLVGAAVATAVWWVMKLAGQPF
jgi:hypothetical protein